jgi:hypothetical protein
MREGASYPGVRVKLPAAIGAARVVVALDFSFGDPGEVEEICYPEILGGASITLRAYPIERVLAEKIATMMERGELNTRDRDSPTCGFSAASTRSALLLCARLCTQWPTTAAILSFRSLGLGGHARPTA